MDALSEALRGMRITGALFFNAEFTAPRGFASPRASTAQRLLAPGTEHLVLFHLVTEGRATARVAKVNIRGDASGAWIEGSLVCTAIRACMDAGGVGT